MSDFTGEMVSFEGAEGMVPGYLVRPNQLESHPAVLLIHEIWGLSDHIKSVAGRLAGQGYVTLAPDLFARPDLADVMRPENISEVFKLMRSIPPEHMGDRDYLQTQLGQLPEARREPVGRAFALMTREMPTESLVRDLVNAVDFLRAQKFNNGKVGSVGFCFGGGLSLNLACHARYDAAVLFYGGNPDPIDQVQNISCPVMAIYGADDTRVNGGIDNLVRAMVTYKKNFEMKIYPNAAHAFFNETNAQGYRPAQAQDAWERLLRFFGTNLS